MVATDNADGDVSSHLTVNLGGVDLQRAGKHEITYSVSDSSGNTTEAKRNLEIRDGLGLFVEGQYITSDTPQY